MESKSHGGDRLIFTAVHKFAGQPEDYRDPTGAVAFAMTRLLYDYVSEGGDLECVQLSTGLERVTTRLSRPRLTVRLHGYGAVGSSARGATPGTTSSTPT